MQKTVKITLTQLFKAGACSDQIITFSRFFPGGEAEVTVERCVELAGYFEWLWAVRHLLDKQQYRSLARTLRALVGGRYSDFVVDWLSIPPRERARLFAEAYIEQERAKVWISR